MLSIIEENCYEKEKTNKKITHIKLLFYMGEDYISLNTTILKSVKSG